MATLRALAQTGATFLTRLEPQTALFAEETRLDLPRWLRQHKHHALLTLPVALSHAQLPCRLVAVHLPPAAQQARRRRLKRRARQMGRAVPKQRLALAAWNLFVTNASEIALPATAVAACYRLRWTIELVFKQFKSGLQIHQWNHANPARLQCEILATLLVAVLLTFTHHLLQITLWRMQRGEASLQKTFRFFLNHAAELFWLATTPRHFSQGALRRLLRQALRDCRQLHQPSRLSSLQRLQEFA